MSFFEHFFLDHFLNNLGLKWKGPLMRHYCHPPPPRRRLVRRLDVSFAGWKSRSPADSVKPASRIETFNSQNIPPACIHERGCPCWF